MNLIIKDVLMQKKRGLENIFNISFRKFNFHENNVNGVGLFDVIEHIEDDINFIHQLKLKLPPKSFIYIAVATHKALLAVMDHFGGHYRRYNSDMIKTLANKSQVQLVYFIYFFSYVQLLTYALKHLPYRIRRKRKDSEIIDSEKTQLSPSGFVLDFLIYFIVGY